MGCVKSPYDASQTMNRQAKLALTCLAELQRSGLLGQTPRSTRLLQNTPRMEPGAALGTGRFGAFMPLI